ncbi:MAG: alpha/beta hydrolase [Alphaproteobacteria bacterium]|nr:alpha/beta hydrolase [Alphaproteobacteria bacterium]
MNVRLRAIALALLAALPGGCASLAPEDRFRAYPAQGEMVEIENGRRLQLDCRGAGTPVIILQAGGDVTGSLAWAPVHDQLAAMTRTCAYSRAGILWSDPRTDPFHPKEVATDLHAALTRTGVQGPYILVGHSRGGLYSLIFAGLFPDDVAGLVLADSSHPDQDRELRSAGVARKPPVIANPFLTQLLRWSGLLQLSPAQADPAILGPVQAFYAKSAVANAREAAGRAQTLALAGEYRDLRNWPLIVLAREPPEQTLARTTLDARNAYLLSEDGPSPEGDSLSAEETVWRRLQSDLATWSSKGRLEVVPNSTHAFFFLKPQIVVKAVSEILAAARVMRAPAPDID